MKHFASAKFWDCYEKLPKDVKELANKNFELLKSDPKHPSLHFKQIRELWSVRVGKHYRALGLNKPDGIIWFWVGSHTDYDRLIR